MGEMQQANFLAPLMLILWFPLTLVLFVRVRPTLAATISIIGAGLVLPSGYAFDFRGLPPIGRETVASLACGFAILYSNRRIFASRMPFQGAESLALVLVVAGFGTVLGNGDPIRIGSGALPSLRLWDAVGVSAEAIFFYGIPYYLGRVLFRDPRDLRILLSVLVIAGLLYLLPILWEARMSPNLHYRLYGYHPAEFHMSKRELFFGWRPMVFVGHGLALSMFVLTTALAAAALRRVMPVRLKRRLSLVTGVLSFFVLICNSVGTIVYSLLTVPVAAFSSPRVFRRVLMSGVFLVFLYPALRASEVFPTTGLVELAGSYSQRRADSLANRFDNEDMLLARARERVWFGWGGYGRNRVYDLASGNDLSTTDGYWIIVFGVRGVIGFLAIFGIMLLPVVGAIRASGRRTPSRETYLVLGTALIVVISAVDLLPNGIPTIRTVFYAGALAGSLQGWSRLERIRSNSHARPSNLAMANVVPAVPAKSDQRESLADGLLNPLGRR
jgi:hypothetical protein